MVQLLPILFVLFVMWFIYNRVTIGVQETSQDVGVREHLSPKPPKYAFITRLRRENPHEKFNVVKLYHYQGREVCLLYSSGNPEAKLYVFDSDGNYIGSPSGGQGSPFAPEPNGDIPDFHRDAVFIRRI